MGNTEIKVIQSELTELISNIRGIITGFAKYRNRSKLISESYGDMADSINCFFNEMKAIELVMDEVVEQTAKALEQAGVQFEISDLTTAKMADEIGKD